MTDLTTTGQTPSLPPPSDGGPVAIPQESFPLRLLHICERAMQDPSVPLDRFERIMATAKEAMAAEAQRQYQEDFSRLQAVLPTFEERGEIDIGAKGGGKKQKYAMWADVNRDLRPLLAQYGFGLTFHIESTEKGMTIRCTNMHRGGGRDSTSMWLPLDQTGSKNIVQSHGSSVSYGKRYTAFALLNITSSDERDDDGNAAGGTELVNEDQLGKIQARIVEVGADIKALCTYFQVADLPSLRASEYERVMAALDKKAAQKKQGNGS